MAPFGPVASLLAATLFLASLTLAPARAGQAAQEKPEEELTEEELLMRDLEPHELPDAQEEDQELPDYVEPEIFEADPTDPAATRPGVAKLSADGDMKKLIGQTYQGEELEIEGWQDLGGGLILEPVWVRHYGRDDGVTLVVTSRELTDIGGGLKARFRIEDVLIVPPPPKAHQFSLACALSPDETLRYVGVARGSNEREWWTEVRNAWEISVFTGEITAVPTKGIRCMNFSWGQ